MELYNIKNNLSDITYKAELILDNFLNMLCYRNQLLTKKLSRINSPKQLTFTLFRKLWAH